MADIDPWGNHPAFKKKLTRGERAADHLRNVMGSWPFVFGFIIVMVLWAVVNTIFLGRVLHHRSFDPYPYILLNLFLSMLAGLQGAILLISAKRADSIAAQLAVHHLKVSEETDKNTERIKSLIEDNTKLTNEVKLDTALLHEIHRHVTKLAPEAGKFEPPPTK